jgi:hypothetical protein
MIKTILDSGQLGYILFFSVYGIDAVVTIINRLIKKEIFQPHRSHLYQYLANEMGILMFFVAIVYAVLQLGINGIIIYKANGSLSLYFVLGFLLVMTFVYLGIRAVIMRQVRLKSR